MEAPEDRDPGFTSEVLPVPGEAGACYMKATSCLLAAFQSGVGDEEPLLLANDEEWAW